MLLPAGKAEASAKTKALKAYNSFLAGNKLVYTSPMMGEQIYTSDCKFAIAYIDKNSVPELILSFDSGDMNSSDSAVYTYKGGKVKRVGYSHGLKSYYKKKGVILSSYSHDQGTSYFYGKMSGGKLKGFLGKSVYGKYNWISASLRGKTRFFDNSKGSQPTLSKASFNSKLKKAVGSKKATKFKFYPNTAAGRSVHLK